MGFSRVMGPTSPGRGAVPPDIGSPLAPAAPAAAAVPAVVPSPSHEVAASLLRSASLRAASPRTRTRSSLSCAAAQTCSTCTASQLQRCLWPAWFSRSLRSRGLVTGLATQSCPPVPPHQLRLSRVSRALHAASAGLQPSADVSGPSAPSAPASEAPRATESASNSDDEWDALLDAHGLAPSLGGTAAAPSPSPADAPPELVGVLATSVVVGQRKAAKRSMWRDIMICFLLLLRALTVWRGLRWWGLLWARACFGGSCRIAGPLRSSPAAPGFGGLFLESSALALVWQSVRPLWKLGEALQAPLRSLGTFLPGRDLLGGHPFWRSVFTGAGSAALGRHSLAHWAWRLVVS